MTIEGALKKVEENGLYVSWMCQGADGLWHVSLRKKADAAFSDNGRRTVYNSRGKGELMVDALLAAIPAPDAFQDLF